MKLYTQYVKDKMKEMILEAGGTRKLATKIGNDVSYVSKVANGKIIPTPSTFSKWTGENVIVNLYVKDD